MRFMKRSIIWSGARNFGKECSALISKRECKSFLLRYQSILILKSTTILKIEISKLIAMGMLCLWELRYIFNDNCTKCFNTFQNVASNEFKPKRLCPACIEEEKVIQGKLEREKRIKHFLYLDTLTIEERLRLIEEWIYDYKPSKSSCSCNTIYG